MAGSSLLTLLDDIATLLDDISVMGKLAAKKTAGVLGDDLSLNAQQVSGVRANRELPVVWGVAKGSFLNKVILVPLALLISAFIPWAITPLLMIGGAFLCFEGVEKVLHSFSARKQSDTPEVRRQRLLDDQLHHGLLELLVLHGRRVLRRDHDRVDALHLALVVLDGDLALGVGAEEVHLLLAAHLRQRAEQ